MTTTAPAAETFTLTEEIHVSASLEQTFDSLLANMGRLNETPDGTPLPVDDIKLFAPVLRDAGLLA